MHTIKKLISTLRALDKLIEDESARNPDFSRKVHDILGQTKSLPKSSAKKSTQDTIPDVMGKYGEFDGDEEKMRNWLARLGTPVCGKIIRKQRFAVGKNLKQYEDMNKLINIIIEGIKKRRNRGLAVLDTLSKQPIMETKN
jgi:hypothetical protein